MKAKSTTLPSSALAKGPAPLERHVLNLDLRCGDHHLGRKMRVSRLHLASRN